MQIMNMTAICSSDEKEKIKVQFNLNLRKMILDL